MGLKIAICTVFLGISSLTMPYALALGQAKQQTPVEQRASDVMSLFREDTGGYEVYFSKSFLAQVPPARLKEVFLQYYSSCGRCLTMEPVGVEGPYTARYTFKFEKKMTVPVNITVDQGDPHLITGLLFGIPVPALASLEDIVAEFKSLPGRSAFLVARLSDRGVEPIASWSPDEELAIGSAFKLYVLSELVRTVADGKRDWRDVVTLRPDARSLPSGVLHKWPVGSPVTLHTLASLMISQSDNTAADELLLALGRENVEKIMSIAGHARPELNIPFVSTGELFKLKGSPLLRQAKAYLSRTTEERRRYLRDSVSEMEIGNLSFTRQPVLIDSLEWFASARDLCRVMNWLRISAHSDLHSTALEILAINPGLNLSKGQWAYTGYKGGSEPGVFNMTYLLQSPKGEWFAVCATWNNRQATLDETKIPGLLSAAIDLIR